MSSKTKTKRKKKKEKRTQNSSNEGCLAVKIFCSVDKVFFRKKLISELKRRRIRNRFL